MSYCRTLGFTLPSASLTPGIHKPNSCLHSFLWVHSPRIWFSPPQAECHPPGDSMSSQALPHAGMVFSTASMACNSHSTSFTTASIQCSGFSILRELSSWQSIPGHFYHIHHQSSLVPSPIQHNANMNLLPASIDLLILNIFHHRIMQYSTFTIWIWCVLYTLPPRVQAWGQRTDHAIPTLLGAQAWQSTGMDMQRFRLRKQPTASAMWRFLPKTSVKTAMAVWWLEHSRLRRGEVNKVFRVHSFEGRDVCGWGRSLNLFKMLLPLRSQEAQAGGSQDQGQAGLSQNKSIDVRLAKRQVESLKSIQWAKWYTGQKIWKVQYVIF